jgi:prolipoprotein diacylglyceryltransferase
MIPIGSHPVWHPVMETLAYAVGFAVYRTLRARQGDIVAEPQRWTVLAAAAVGALVGSRALGLAEQWPTVTEAWRTGRMLELLLSPGGKTIVGGLLGGWLGVEIAKKLSGIKRRTGDLFALPLCVGIAVGRVGCLLAGLADDTYGKPTGLPWAVNLGDGIGRHPVQVYEILFLALLGLAVSIIPVASSVPVNASSSQSAHGSALASSSVSRHGSAHASSSVSGHDFSRAETAQRKSRALAPEGARFRIFLGGYLAWRLAIDFLKPQPLFDGLNLIQWSCLAGILLLIFDEARVWKGKHETIRA